VLTCALLNPLLSSEGLYPVAAQDLHHSH
jgi:hypothetical protein